MKAYAGEPRKNLFDSMILWLILYVPLSYRSSPIEQFDNKQKVSPLSTAVPSTSYPLPKLIVFAFHIPLATRKTHFRRTEETRSTRKVQESSPGDGFQ